MKREVNKKNNKFEIIIRPRCNIRSRQWWASKLTEARKLFIKHLPIKNKKLFKASSISILVTNNKEILNLNKKYRDINKSTDVLSFHLHKDEQLKKKYLGDIVISIQTAKKQALIKKKSLNSELLLLLVHAYLHLLGYDHKLAKEAKSMFSLQNKILNNIKQ